jgi:hypothetical protein
VGNVQRLIKLTVRNRHPREFCGRPGDLWARLAARPAQLCISSGILRRSSM